MARRWGVTPEGLRSKARIKTLTVPRQIAMYLARELLQMQLVEIGQAFGGRDHSTVIHSVDKVQRQMSRDRDASASGSIMRAQELCAAIIAAAHVDVWGAGDEAVDKRAGRLRTPHIAVDRAERAARGRWTAVSSAVHISRPSTTTTSSL